MSWQSALCALAMGIVLLVALAGSVASPARAVERDEYLVFYEYESETDEWIETDKG